MPIVMDAAEAAQRRKPAEVKGVTGKASERDSFFITRFIGALTANVAHIDDSGPEARALPQAYLVEQPPHGVVAPHFHEVDQFQVVVAGSARLGKQEAVPLALHFSGPHTPYGPITAGPDGVHYFTLRRDWDPGAKPMTASRDLLKPVERRHRLPAPIALPDAGALAAAEVAVESIIAPEADGLAAAAFRLGPGRNTELDLAVPGGGQFALVFAGSLTADGAELPANSCLYRDAAEDPLTVTAGEAGAAVLVMQFPRG